MSGAIKQNVLSIIAKGAPFIPAGRAKYRVNEKVVHVRFCSENKSSPAKYKFNINPNTLSADCELWICGSEEQYYLMPMTFIKSIYDNPETYVDYHHDNIKVVSVDIYEDKVQFASGGQSESLNLYKGASIDEM